MNVVSENQEYPKHGGGIRSLLIVALIIAVLAAVIHPIFAKARQSAQKRACLANLKSLGIYLQMYMQDNGNKLPEASSFGPELDKHTALWGARGDIFAKPGVKPKYYPEVCEGYIKNPHIPICPRTSGEIWSVPGGKVAFKDTYYTFNAWCVVDSTKKPPAGCLKIAGRSAEKCGDPALAPILWDSISGYGQLAHGDSINVVYMDSHAKNVPMQSSAGIKDRSGHFWGTPDPNRKNGTLGAAGWEYIP